MSSAEAMCALPIFMRKKSENSTPDVELAEIPNHEQEEEPLQGEENSYYG